jgi:hypothetical protein
MVKYEIGDYVLRPELENRTETEGWVGYPEVYVLDEVTSTQILPSGLGIVTLKGTGNVHWSPELWFKEVDPFELWVLDTRANHDQKSC